MFSFVELIICFSIAIINIMIISLVFCLRNANEKLFCCWYQINQSLKCVSCALCPSYSANFFLTSSWTLNVVCQRVLNDFKRTRLSRRRMILLLLLHPLPSVNKASKERRHFQTTSAWFYMYFRQSPAIFTKLNYEEQLHFGGFFPKLGFFLDFLYLIVSGTRSAPFCVIPLVGKYHPVRCRWLRLHPQLPAS